MPKDEINELKEENARLKQKVLDLADTIDDAGFQLMAIGKGVKRDGKGKKQ